MKSGCPISVIIVLVLLLCHYVIAIVDFTHNEKVKQHGCTQLMRANDRTMWSTMFYLW